MKILVTGGAGYIGSHTVQVALEKGFEVVVFDNLWRGHENLIPPKAEFFKGDLRNLSDLEKVFSEYKIDGVMHFAASSCVGESVQHPDFYYQNNLIGSLNLLDSMVKHGVGKLIFSSSAAVYGQPDVKIIHEKILTLPINPYGKSKRFFEEILEDYQEKFDLSFISLRYFNAAGAHMDGHLGENHDPETHLIPLILDVALGKRPAIKIYGTDYPTKDGTCIRDYIHVCDIAEAHMLAIEKLDSFSGEFINLGTGEGHSVLEVIETCKKITGTDFSVENTPRRSGDPSHLVASYDKASSLLEWQAQFNLDDIVRTAWKWHQNY